MDVLKNIAGFVIFAFLFLVSSNALHAIEFSSTNFKVVDPVIQPGAGFSTSTSFQLQNLFGQSGIGLSNSSNFILKGGFLYFPAPSTLTVATSPTGIVLAPGGGGSSIQIKTPLTAEALATVDFNSDGKINIIDLSIMLFYYERPSAGIEKYDLNGDGLIDFVDLSILFYYWIF